MVNISVTIDQAHLSGIGDVAEALRARGMQINQVLESGFITGSITNDRRSALDAVEGVQSVDKQLAYQLPPAEDDIQ